MAAAGYQAFAVAADAPMSLPAVFTATEALDTTEDVESQISCIGMLIVGAVALQLYGGMRVKAYALAAAAAAADDEVKQVLRESEKAEEGRGRCRLRRMDAGDW